MSTVGPAFQPEAYTVGWITIINPEFAAARAMLDEQHQRPQVPDDPFLYAAGRINGHNVVIAHSGEAGTNPANHCATQMMRSFPNIKIDLLAGIGGGVPSDKNDIRLGDVVVSRPGQGYGGVAFYDAGKLTDGGFEWTDHLNRPPLALSNAVNFMETDKTLGDTQLSEYLASMRPAEFASSEGLPDKLYEAGDLTKKVIRQPRKAGQGPVIHYGLVASGSWLIKTSDSKRDDLIKRVKGDVLCFEMEAAGLMNTFPCLVVRGVSDYCDSHKNDGWHNYASATAACYCKWLLKVIRPEDLRRTGSAADVTSQPGELENTPIP